MASIQPILASIQPRTSPLKFAVRRRWGPDPRCRQRAKPCLGVHRYIVPRVYLNGGATQDFFRSAISASETSTWVENMDFSPCTNTEYHRNIKSFRNVDISKSTIFLLLIFGPGHRYREVHGVDGDHVAVAHEANGASNLPRRQIKIWRKPKISKYKAKNKTVY